jgi:hypothetical protein
VLTDAEFGGKNAADKSHSAGCLQYLRYRAHDVSDPQAATAESQCNKGFTQHSSGKIQKNQPANLLQCRPVFLFWLSPYAPVLTFTKNQAPPFVVSYSHPAEPARHQRRHYFE